MDSVDWAAGIYEGEGTCIYHRRPSSDGKDRRWPQMQIKMCDEDIIRRVHAVVEAGYVTGPLLPPSEAARGHKPQWMWMAGAEDAQRVARMFLPFLGKRRTEQILPLLGWERRQAKRAACGTESGRVRHQRLGEPVCDACQEARREARRQWRLRQALNP